MGYAKLINRIYEDTSDSIQVLEAMRDNVEGLTDHETNILAELNVIWESCRRTGVIPSVYLQVRDDLTINFDFVTAGWIKEFIEKTDTSQKDLAAGMNVGASQISQWLSGARNPSGATQAGIYYYFERLLK
jgi:hypothetical protein